MTTGEKWKAHVDAWATSGLSVAEYAVKAGVHPGTLAGWRSKLKSTQAPDLGKPVTFVEIAERSVAEVASASGMIELIVGGRQIVIRGRVEVEALRSVVVALEGRQ